MGFSDGLSALTADVALAATDPVRAATVLGADADFIVNATGSLVVREALSLPDVASWRPRCVEACLLGAGRVAYMAVEGPSANPSSADLAAEAYRLLGTDDAVAAAVFGPWPPLPASPSGRVARRSPSR